MARATFLVVGLAASFATTAMTAPVASAAAEPADVDAALRAALPADGATDVAFIDHPATPHAPRVRFATIVGAPPAAIKAVLLDTAHYRQVISGLVRSEAKPADGGGVSLAWELEIPLFNLEGRITLRERPDGVELLLAEGDLAPGRILFTMVPRGTTATTLTVDAQLDIGNSTWLLRRIMARSPVGEPAGLIAAAYVALRAVALRAEHTGAPRPVRPGAPPEPPPAWMPDPAPLATPALAALRARGVVGLVSRTGTQRLGGATVVVPLALPPPALAARLRDPRGWAAFPGWGTIRPQPGAHGVDARVEDSIPLADLDATWVAQPGPLARWTAADGVTRGARLGWELFPSPPAGPTIAALTLYPRLETTGRIARKSIANEPLLEHGLSLAVAFAYATATKTAFENKP